jgi:hypothetical protein
MMSAMQNSLPDGLAAGRLYRAAETEGGIIGDELALRSRGARSRKIGRTRRSCAARTVSGAPADNAAQAHVRGSFVARMDCDDISLPERFAAQLRAMQRDHLDICGSQRRFCGGRDEPVWFPERHEAIVHELVFGQR